MAERQPAAAFDASMPERVGVVVIHRDQPTRLAATVARFRDQDVDVDLIVVDNASTSEHRAQLDHLSCPVIDAGANTGFGPGLNIGIRHWLRRYEGDWLVLAPHDALMEPGGLRRLVDIAESQTRAGIICADVGDQATPHIDHVLGALPGPAHVHAGWEDADYPHGTLIMIRRECLLDIGLIDERYFAYNDEADLGLRAQAAGWEVGLARGVVVENPSTSTAPAIIDYLRLRNTILLIGTHFGPGKAFMRALIAVVNVVHASLRPQIRPPWYDGRARLHAVLDAGLGRYGAPRS